VVINAWSKINPFVLFPFLDFLQRNSVFLTPLHNVVWPLAVIVRASVVPIYSLICRLNSDPGGSRVQHKSNFGALADLEAHPKQPVVARINARIRAIFSPCLPSCERLQTIRCIPLLPIFDRAYTGRPVRAMPTMASSHRRRTWLLLCYVVLRLRCDGKRDVCARNLSSSAATK